MEVFLYREDLKKRVLYPFDTEQAYTHFITKLMKFKILQTFKTKFLIEVPDEFLRKEEYNGSVWYRSLDKKFGVFMKDEELKVIFQQ